ncbi:MAG: serine/threonine-protein kinase [Microcoleaceae cyanobacterium]
MSYCIHPACLHPQNPNNVKTCQACGSRLVLRKRYHIIKPLGKGGFGATFLARDLSLPGVPSCVVKQLRPTVKSRRVLDMAQQLFQREAKTLGKIGNHPQVPRLLDYFVGKQQFYLVQEHIDGCTLKQEVKGTGTYDEEKIQTFLREILPILDYIHFQGVIHRDIKPANIIRRRQDNRLVLIDFGAVKDEVSQVSVAGTGETAFTDFAIGTSGFAPPEQMSLRPVYASDIYAVGMSCVYLLTGQSPNRLQHDPMTGELLWRSQVTVSEGFAQILEKMLEMSVRHRYQSAQQVIDALDNLAVATTLETRFEDLSDGLSIQPAATTTTFLEEPLNSALEQEQTIYKEDSASPLSPFALEASKIRELRTRRAQKVGISERNLSNEYGNSFSATQGAPRTSFDRPNSSRIQTKNPNASHPSSAGEEWTQQRLKSAYTRGERYFTECDLSYFNLESTKFSGAYFSGCKLIQTNFQAADLSSVNFSRAQLTYAVLRDANLRNAYLSTADLERADLRGADLTGACLRRANLRGANLCGADLTNALISKEQIAGAKTNWRTIKPDGKRTFGI